MSNHKTAKQAAAARENGKLGGRPKTGQVERVMVSLPADFIARIDAQTGNCRFRVRWILEHLEPVLRELETKAPGT